jgi:dihydrolipoamide dehydrogenase
MAALTAAELGATVTLIERDRVGGTALNTGPAPVRSYARAARLMRDWNSWERFGLRGPRPEIDFEALRANANSAARAAHEKRRIADLIRSLGVDVVEAAGDVRFLDPATLASPDGRTWTGDRVIIAVGGRPARPRLPGADLGLTLNDIPKLQSIPARAAVIGVADTGCQIASILADLGSRVWLVGRGERILPSADEDVSTELAHAFKGRGIEIVTGASVERLELLEPAVRLVYSRGNRAEADHFDVDAVFFAVGWPGNGDLIHAEAAGIRLERNFVWVDDFLRTNIPSIFAAGDANGHSMLVSSARLEGRVAAENAVLGPRRRVVHDIVPGGSFTDPEYASVGLAEAQARQRYDCAVAVARYEDLLRPVVDGQPEGFCKLIVERDRRQVIGAHVIGEYSAEVIQMVAACMAAGMRIEEIAELQFAFPTFGEGIGMAAQLLVRELGVRAMPMPWSSLRS